MKVPILSELKANGIDPEYLFWVGWAGSFDERSKKVTKAFIKILNKANVSFAILGKEESCTGDPAKRAGNEFLFQMQAMSNIEILNSFDIKTIVTTCPRNRDLKITNKTSRTIPDINIELLFSVSNSIIESIPPRIIKKTAILNNLL